MYDTSKPVRILIIDDDEDDFILTREYLTAIEDRQLNIEWCFNYKSALTHIASKSSDIYFVDYRLGAKTGIDLLKEAMERC